MMYQWGFDLDMTAVRLMRREGGIWHEIAVEKIDGPDIEDRLMGLVGRLDGDATVDVFLPREQILYTDVDITSDEAAQGEIDAAMEGLTPYRLDELEIDWIRTSDTTARVAAIAIETLDEAAAFAEARGLTVRSYSSLADPADFPRLPDFGGKLNIFELAEPEQDEDAPVAVPVEAAPEAEPEDVAQIGPAPEPAAPADEVAPTLEGEAAGEVPEEVLVVEPAESPVAFASARSTSRTPIDEATLGREPVVKVDDPTPVMTVKTREAALDPGDPLVLEPSAPRIRTDIAASSVSGHAASLSPPPSIQVRKQGTGLGRTALVFAIAAVLTIGIAIIVWQLLPLGPGQTTNGAIATTEAEATEIASLPAESEVAAPLPSMDEPTAPSLAEATSQTPAAPEETDVAAPDVVTTIASLSSAPGSDDDAGLPALSRITPVSFPAPDDLTIPTVGDTPTGPVDAFEQRPVHLRSIVTDAPADTLAAPTGEAADDTPLRIASVEPTDLSFAPVAFAAPDVSADGLPSVGEPPAEATALAPNESDDTAPQDTAAVVDLVDVPTENAAPGIEEPANESEVAALDSDIQDTPSPEVIPAPAEAETIDQVVYVQTDLARSLPDRKPASRPERIVEDVERQKFGGRTREQLARLTPPARPASAQATAEAERDATPSEFAVATSAQPRSRPSDFDALVAASLVQREAARITASLDFETPDTSGAIEAALSSDAEPESRPQDTPRLAIPSDASVARQATLEDAIRLNRLNLVGVYGVPSDRRALIRLPSGRYVKVKVGDRVDGGTVAQIKDSELIYRKGGRNIALTMPRG